MFLRGMGNIVKSGTTTRVLCCLLCSINAAYLFKGDVLAAKFFAIGLLLLVVVLLFIGEFSRGQRGTQEAEQGLWGVWTNAMFAGLILLSVRGWMA